MNRNWWLGATDHGESEGNFAWDHSGEPLAFTRHAINRAIRINIFKFL